MKLFLLAVGWLLASTALAAETNAPPVVPESQLKHLKFDQKQNEKEKPPKVTPLSFSQEFILKQDRKDIKAILARHLGILDLHGDKRDLSTIQQLIDRNVLKPKQLKQWQEVGVVFGDILANEFGLHWVSYQDDEGLSTALQWRDTQNFVFPVTMFSKRVEFGDKVNVDKLYNKIAEDVRQFIAYESKIPRE